MEIEVVSGLSRTCAFRILALAVLCLLPAEAVAQEPTSRVELGAGVAGMQLFNDAREYRYTAGLTGQLDVNIAPGLAVESRLSWFPRTMPGFDATQGGRTLVAAVGLRGSLFERRTLSVYGFVLPGVVRFSNALTGFRTTPLDEAGHLLVTDVVEPTTHFALVLGGGLQLSRPGSRWLARFELLDTVHAAPGASVAAGPPGPSGRLYLVSDAAIVSAHQLSASMSYRLGRTSTPPVRAGAGSQKWRVGAQTSYMLSASAFGMSALNHDAGLGAFASCRLANYLDADFSVMTFPQPTATFHTPLEGGTMVQALGGVKIGLTRGRIGVFWKLRAGVNSHAQAVAPGERVAGAYPFRRYTVPAFEAGGVMEVSLFRAALLRFDVGDTTSIHEVTPDSFGEHSYKDAIQMTAGFGWRF